MINPCVGEVMDIGKLIQTITKGSKIKYNKVCVNYGQIKTKINRVKNYAQ